jgi:hypothetical protein
MRHEGTGCHPIGRGRMVEGMRKISVYQLARKRDAEKYFQGSVFRIFNFFSNHVIRRGDSEKDFSDMHFRNKKREYLKDKINELAMNSKNKNIRDLYTGINEFKRGYQPRSNIVNDENGDCLQIPTTF